MKVTLLDHTASPEVAVGRMAAICYDSKTDDESCVKRTAHCRDSGHLATLRFAYATVNITGISRVCSHQLVRVAHAGILQASQRYIKQTNIEYIDPPALIDLPIYARTAWAKIQADAEALYLHLVDGGYLKKEDARYILPQGCDTALNLCLNFQGWRDIIKNRTSKHAQWEIRTVFKDIDRQLGGIAPNLFGNA